MADAITIKALQDASLDAKSLEEVVNGDDAKQVTTRLGENYPSVKKAIKQMFENGGLPATPFSTYLEMTQAGLPDKSLAFVTSEEGRVGLYQRNGSSWERSKYDISNLVAKELSGNFIATPPVLTTESNVDDLVDTGIYIIPFAYATPENNHPLDKSHGLVIVTRAGTTTRQAYFSELGYLYRIGLLISGEWEWRDWSGVDFGKNNTIIGFDNLVKKGELSAVALVNIEDFGGHLDSITNSGMYHSVLRSTATAENGFPIVGQTGFLIVRASNNDSAGFTTQIWQTYAGYAMRWGNYGSGGNIEWQAWRGFKYDKNGILDLGKISGGSTSAKLIYGWGSSSLELAASYFTAMAERHGHVYIGHGVSGETLAVSGMHQGSNIVTLKFADAALTNGTNHAVTITQSFKPKRGRSYKEVELSNGVKGLLYFSENSTNANTFKPTNLTEPLAVDTTYEYRAINPDFINQGKGLYYFDIGKNNMGYADTAQDIVDAQQEMIDYIPEGSEYLVGGHFVNTGTSGSDYANKVVAVNQMLKLRYGLRFCDYYDFLYDDAVWAKYGITKTAEDIAAIAVGELPPSMGRDIGTETRDVSHLRDEMSAEIALQAEARFIKLGYIK